MRQQGVDDTLQRGGNRAQVIRDGHALVVRDHSHAGRPQAMPEQVMLDHFKALEALALDQHQPWSRPAQTGDARQGAGGVENGWCATVTIGGFTAGCLAHLGALFQSDDAKWRLGLEALANHVKVTHLKYLQWQVATGKQHGAQREQRE